VSTNTLFEIEFDGNSEQGRWLTWTDEQTNKPVNYRLRHLNSGRVLTVKPISRNGKEIMIMTS